MKLQQITEEVTEQQNIKGWFDVSNEDPSAEVEFHDDGTITYHGDLKLRTPYPVDFPKVRLVTGRLVLEDVSYTDFLSPEAVGGAFEIHLKYGAKVHVKTSQLPKCNQTAKGFGFKRFVLDGSSGTVDIDDVSVLQSYKTVNIGFGVTSGIGHISSIKTLICIGITDNFEGIPVHLKLPGGVVFFRMTDPEKVKQLGKTLRSIEAEAIYFTLEAPAPILNFFRNTTAKQVMINGAGLPMVQSSILANLISTALKEGKDIFEIQELMIENNFSQFAR